MIIQDSFLNPYFIKAEGKNFELIKLKTRNKKEGGTEQYQSKLGNYSSLDSALSVIVKDKLTEDKSKIKRSRKKVKPTTLSEGFVRLKSYVSVYKDTLNELRKHLSLTEIQ